MPIQPDANTPPWSSAGNTGTTTRSRTGRIPPGQGPASTFARCSILAIRQAGIETRLMAAFRMPNVVTAATDFSGLPSQ